MRVLVGVDAGGSSTTAAVSAIDTIAVLHRVERGPGAIRPLAVDQAANVIADTVAGALTGVPDAVPAIVVVGAAGAGREDARVELTQILSQTLPCPVVVRTDAEVAHHAAFHGNAGAILIVGTGAISLARDMNGTFYRVGGYGHVFADEIGGYNLGRGVLAAIGQAHDGRGPSTRLDDAVFAVVGVDGFDQLVSWANQAEPAEIASLARIAIELGSDGDKVATLIVGEAVGHLAAYVRRVVELAQLDRPEVALHGGLMQSGSVLRNAVAGTITEHLPGARVRPDRVDPTVGALEIARDLL